MIRNYTISSLKELRNLSWLDICQFTLNSRQFPSKRQTVKLLREVSKLSKTKIIVHYDFIYIISRYLMFKQEVREAVLTEIHDILSEADKNNLILGIIMHTDFPIKKSCINYNGLILDKIVDSYQSSVWDVAIIQSIHDPSTVVELSIKQFYQDYLTRYSLPKKKIYLENSTKTGKIAKDGIELCTVEYFVSLLNNNSHLKDLFGICIDTEHEYAVTGHFYSVSDIEAVKLNGIDVIVHLNIIPAEVAPKSYKDRHSENTIFECSLNSKEFYNSYVESLNRLQIPFVREVHETAMNREQEQYKLWKK